MESTSVTISTLPTGTEHEVVLMGEDPECGYRAIIAIHSTRLGPAVGGTRLWNYESIDEALSDALRLSRGMTFKNAAAGLALGGGKSVILKPAGAFDREMLFRAHGRFVHSLGGRYITAEDVGSSPADMLIMRTETPHVAGLPELSGDPSPVTARGVFRAIQAAALHRWGSEDLGGRRVALQGCGNVGYHLARELRAAGADLLVADVNAEATMRAARELKAEIVNPRHIHQAAAHIFAPCALGGTLNSGSISELRCEIIAGAANNQLLEASDANRIEARGILYVPDFIANAGGVINGTRELLGWDRDRVWAKVEAIYDTTLEIFRLAETMGITTAAAAERVALAQLERA
jgi:leucine dehydrogenase